MLADMSSFRFALLQIDRFTALPLYYEYDEAISSYRTLGYVRLHSVMRQEVVYPGRDTSTVRDDFLTDVLVGLRIPEGQARQIVQKAEHSGAVPDASATAVDEPHAPLCQEAMHESWGLLRMSDEVDFWQLINMGERELFPVDASFSITRGAQSWTDGALLWITVPVLGPGGSTRMHIVGSDHVTKVTTRWRSRRSRFSRLREWTVRF